MNRKGDSREKPIVMIIAIFVLVIVAIGLFSGSDKLNFITDLFDLRSGEAPAGVTILGVNLENNHLAYYTGEKWKDIPDKPTFTLTPYAFVPNRVSEKFKEFYLAERRPVKGFSGSINSWRYYFVDPRPLNFGDIRVSVKTKNGFSGPSTSEQGNIDYLGDINFKEVAYASTTNFISTNFLPLEIKGVVKDKIITWRDQTLEGNSCEKFLSLDLQEGTTSSTKQFTVRKIGKYIFIDLSKYISDGTNQKYLNENCFNLENYNNSAVDRSKWKNYANVEFYFTQFNGFNRIAKLNWENNEWYYSGDLTSLRKIKLSEENSDVPLEFREGRGNSFYEGIKQFSRQSGAFYKLEVGFKEPISFKFGDKSSSYMPEFAMGENEFENGWSSENYNRFIYGILNEYNNYLQEPKIVYTTSLDSSNNLVVEIISPLEAKSKLQFTYSMNSKEFRGDFVAHFQIGSNDILDTFIYYGTYNTISYPFPKIIVNSSRIDYLFKNPLFTDRPYLTKYQVIVLNSLNGKNLEDIRKSQFEILFPEGWSDSR